MIYKIENNIVTQVWASGKSLKQLQKSFPNADLREGDAVAGQVWNGTTLSDPVIPFDAVRATEDLWRAATDYEAQYITGSAPAMVAVNAAAGKPMAMAVQDWDRALWTDYYTRKADLENASLDFSNNGPMPYTIAELMSE